MQHPQKMLYHKKFNQLWNRFQNGYKPPIYNPEQAADSNGRKNSLTLSIHIDQPDIIRQIQNVTDEIRHIPGVYLMPPEYYHITVKWLGFLTNRKHHRSDIESPMLERILEQADLILSHLPEFSIQLGRVNGLASFIVLEVEDKGAIAHIQQQFHQDAPLVPTYSIEGEHWLPHLSIAGLNNLDGLSTLKAKMKELRHIEIGEIHVPHVDLLQAVLQKPCPQCRILRSFSLAHPSCVGAKHSLVGGEMISWLH